jgi:hypothetical protein
MTEEEIELYQNQKNLALKTIDDLTALKIELKESDVEVPRFVNNAISYLKKKYLVQDVTIGQYYRRNQDK